MATTQDILTTPRSGYNYTDALLAAGPDWNFLTSNGVTYRTTLYYSFATDGTQYETRGLQGFNAAQQKAALDILAYITQTTGIQFAAAPSSAAADLHFASADIINPELGGVCYAGYSYTGTTAGQLTSYSADAYIYLDSLQTANQAPVAGTWGYQALLHEIGHALGLKHPFEATQDASTTLTAPYQDNTAHTVMSYTDAAATYYSQFNEYDLAALHFLYGTDGLGGSWGVGTAGRYLTGSSLDDTFTLPSGQVTLVDMGGTDMVRYAGAQMDYTIAPTLDKLWLYVSGAGTNQLISGSVEYLTFADGTVETRALLNPDPVVPDPVVVPITDTVRYDGAQKDYTFVPTLDKLWLHVSGPGTDQLIPVSSVEYLSFADGIAATKSLLNPKGWVVLGSAAADLLTGTAGSDLIFGSTGNDTLRSGGGNDLLAGGGGLDTVQLDEQLNNVVISCTDGTWSLSERYGVLSLSSIERLQFLDGKLALDLGTDESAGMAALLTAAVKGESSLADQGFVGEMISLFDSGKDLHQICGVITGADWFKVATGGTDTGFVNLVYGHVVGSTPSTADQSVYLGMLAGHGGSLSQADLLAVATLSQVNQDAIDLVGLQQTGLAFL